MAKSGTYRKWALFTLLGIIGLLFLFFVLLNLPFSQRFATRQVNQVLERSAVPIHLEAIRKILPGSVGVQGIYILDTRGDTLVMAGELQADIRLTALIRNKVLISRVELDAARIGLAREVGARDMNIAEAFGPGKKGSAADRGNAPSKWKISVREGRLTNIEFRMDDSVGGIHILQAASEIGIRDFGIMLAEESISLRSLYLRNADGYIRLSHGLVQPEEGRGSTWNMNFRDIELEDAGFAFSSDRDSMRMEGFIGRGSVRTNVFDLASRTIDLKKLYLDGCRLAYSGGSASGRSQEKVVDDISFPWNILSGDMEVRDSELMLDTAKGWVFRKIDLQMADLRLDPAEAGLKLRKLNFDMENGFTLEGMSAQLDSHEGRTDLELDARTRSNRIELNASAEENLWGIISHPDRLSRATLELEQSRFSPEDFSALLPGIPEGSLIHEITAPGMALSGQLDLEGASLHLSGLQVSQGTHFKVSLEGAIHDIWHLNEATLETSLQVSDLDQDWLEKLAIASGITRSIPDLTGLKLEGEIRDSLLSPDLYLSLWSPLGSADLGGTLDLRKERYDLAYSIKHLALPAFLEVPGLGFFSGAGEMKGIGFNPHVLHASFYLQVDTFGLKGYDYRDIQLTGTLEPGTYGMQVVANDSALKGDVQLEFQFADSAYTLRTEGILQAQLNELNLHKDSLAIHTGFEAGFVRKGGLLESDFFTGDLSIITPRQTARLGELRASFKSDSLHSAFRADADFLRARMDIVASLDDLDSLGRGYRDYFASFRRASHIAGTDRVALLPELDATVSVSAHEFLYILLGDSSLQFTNLDGSIRKRAESESLHATIKGSAFSWKTIDSETLHAEITDSAGSILMKLAVDSASLQHGPDHRVSLIARSSDRKLMSSFYVDDYRNVNLYRIELAGRVDSSQIVIEMPGESLTLNGSEWQLEGPEFITIDLAENLSLPSLKLKRGPSHLYLSARRKDPFITYVLDMEEVELSSLVRNDIFRGAPQGKFSGTVEYRTDRDSETNLSTNLLVSNIRYSNQDFSDVQIDGVLGRGSEESYEVDLSARMDSLDIRLKGRGDESGKGTLEGTFTHFPLTILEPFSFKSISDMRGSVSGNFRMGSGDDRDYFEGRLEFQDARMKVNQLNTSFRIPDQGIDIRDRSISFRSFTVLDTLNRPLVVDGSIDLGNNGLPRADLNITSSNMQVMTRRERTRAAFTGNIFIDSRITVRGPLTRPSIGGRVKLAEGTQIYYQYMEDMNMTETQRTVNFVQHSSAPEPVEAPVLSGRGQPGSSSIGTLIEIDPKTRINFTLARRLFNIDLSLTGGGNLQYNMENERMALSGRYEVREGATLLKLVGWPNKSFRLVEGGYIRWDGTLENPDLGLEAENRVSTSYINPIDGRSRDIDFFVILRLSGYLADLDVQFTIRTPDQYVMSIINTLSPEEQMRQAISVLLFEVIDLPGISSSTDYMTQQVNQILASQLNQLTQSAIKGVDISFGLDSYDQSPDGSSGSGTSLSYEVSKTFMNNRAQIEFSGRLKDASQETGNSDHSLNNLSFEYSLDSAATKYLKVYNEHTYDDVFEGEVINTGIGFSFKKRYRTFKDIWRRKE